MCFGELHRDKFGVENAMWITAVEPIIVEVPTREPVKGVLDGCEAVAQLKMAADVVNEPAVLDRGVIRLGNRPGFGVEIDPQALARVREV